jgi:hypothetical protein
MLDFIIEDGKENNLSFVALKIKVNVNKNQPNKMLRRDENEASMMYTFLFPLFFRKRRRREGQG